MNEYLKGQNSTNMFRKSKLPNFEKKISANFVSCIFRTVRDIDLYTGGLSEIPIAGGLLGPTLTCLIADQFYRLKYGDRFWYETYEKPQAFTPGNDFLFSIQIM